MIVGALQTRVYFANGKSRYSTPSAWKAGEKHPNVLKTVGFREALTCNWSHITGPESEIWLYPLASQNGAVLRPRKIGRKLNTDIIERELKIKLFTSGVFIDLDDSLSHKESTLRTKLEWFQNVEAKTQPYRELEGCFYYRTLRGARIGLIFQTPVDFVTGDRARKTFFAQLQKTFENDPQVEVDEASIEITRGFAAPLIYKKGEKIQDHFPNLYIHKKDMSAKDIQKLADMWTLHLKSLVAQTTSDSARRSENPQSASALKGDSDLDARTYKKNKKQKVFIPSTFNPDEIEGSEAYELFRDLTTKCAGQITQYRPLLLDIAKVIDEHVSKGRRSEAGQLESMVDNVLGYVEPVQTLNKPSPIIINEFPDLLPLKRVFSFPLDDFKFAQSVLESMGTDPTPIWHGDGLRQYSKKTGIWKIYRKPQLEKIFTKLEGAQVENEKGEPKTIALTMQRVSSGVKMLQSLTYTDDAQSPFDTAPSGVVLGDFFVSSTTTGLQINTHSPDHYAIHSLKYNIYPEILQYWDNEDTGQEPKKPKIFIDTFLKKSLYREPYEDETSENVKNEIEAKITTIGQWLGLALLGLCTREATALVCFGEGSNGKSVLASLISDLFGPEQTSHLAPQAMKERFSRAQLFGSTVNVVSEMPESDLLESDTLKAMISGDSITVEHKNEKPFRMKPRAAHFFCANKLPASKDRSYGLWRRLVPIEFHHIFYGNERDPDLLNKLRSEYHLLVPWALDHARIYIENQGYTHQKHIDLWRGNWRIETDALSAFIAYKCEITKDSCLTSAKKLWQAFKVYATDVGQSGASKMSLNAFSRSISAQPHIKKFRRREEGTHRSNSPVAHFNLKLIKSENDF